MKAVYTLKCSYSFVRGFYTYSTDNPRIILPILDMKTRFEILTSTGFKFKTVFTGTARLSSARVVRCLVNS